MNNFSFLHERLGATNKLPIGETSKDFICPMVYPYYTADDNLRKRLIANKVFVATYWPNVLDWCRTGELEADLCKHVIPIPIDQRYGREEMEKIIGLIKEI